MAAPAVRWSSVVGEGPVVAVAIHAGHEVRAEVAPFLELEEATRLREEDPFTGEWSRSVGTRFVVEASRFELDLNRPRELAIYREPKDAWGLAVFPRGLPDDVAVRSLLLYDRFYAELFAVLIEKEREHGRFLVVDLHSYNHRRAGPDAPPAPSETNPDINLGTASMPKGLWEPVVEAFLDSLRHDASLTSPLDVRENVRFLGGELVRWVHRSFPRSGCALAVEVKKIFMDEWTGELDPVVHGRIGTALARAIDRAARTL